MALLTGCHKPCTLPNYDFSVSDFFSPEKDSVTVGDTLWLISNISNVQVDINSGAQVDFSGAENLGFNLVVSDISKFRSQRGAVDSFDYTKRHGDIYTHPSSNPQGIKQLSFEKTMASYMLEVGLIAKKKGSYLLTVPDNPYVFRQDMPKCGTAAFAILNSNANKHLYLFENYWGKLNQYDSTHSYCFKVY